MKNSTRRLCIAIALAGICFSSSARATIILDSYEGASSVKSDGSSYGDVIGDPNNFQINYMDVSISGNILSVSIDTTFGGKGDDGLFSGVTSGMGIGYGDLFLSSSWTPCLNTTCSEPYATDDHDNGTIWTYGFSLDNRWGVEGTTHDGTLYELKSGNNDADALLSDDFLTTNDFYYRNGQEIAVDTNTGNVEAVGSGTWSTTANKVNFEIDLTGTALATSDKIALHWGMTCGNDTIEGEFVRTPEPTILGLLGLGILGMSLSRRKKT